MFVLWIALFAPPISFPVHNLATIKTGSSVTETANNLAAAGVIKWPLVFRLVLALSRGESLVVAGDYYFEQPINVWRVAGRVARGEYDLAAVKVTFPEGTSAKEMGEILNAALPNFDLPAFVAAALPLEGQLFPDTYFFQPTIKVAEIIKRLQTNFQDKIQPLESAIKKSERALDQIIIMASLIEKEARTDEARRTIAGILWKRLDEGMPLQVDAVFPYIIDKNTFELSRQDLATSSPYNTYRFRGLPAGPITNPGLEAIAATLDPIPTDYWYYLSDRDSRLHYAVDFDNHLANKAKYLR